MTFSMVSSQLKIPDDQKLAAVFGHLTLFASALSPIKMTKATMIITKATISAMP
jgi:hypothetical protein